MIGYNTECQNIKTILLNSVIGLTLVTNEKFKGIPMGGVSRLNKIKNLYLQRDTTNPTET